MTSPRPAGDPADRDQRPETPEQGRGEVAATTTRPAEPTDRGRQDLERR